MGQSHSRRDTTAPNTTEKDCEAVEDGEIAAASTPRTRVLQDEIDGLAPHQHKDWQRWEGKEYAIIPHTDAAGDNYGIGDAYEGIKLADQWKLNEPGPYLQYIKHLSKTLPHLAYLGHWMEVSAAPPKWKYLQYYQTNRETRWQKAKVCVIDYTNHEAKQRDFSSAPDLQAGLDAVPQTEEQAQVRLIVTEDLSRDLVETLGSYYDIDPSFFLSHIDDYLFHNTRDPWAQLPSLDFDARKRSHFCLQYLRGRYFKDEEEYATAELESGNWNILRRLDSDRSRKRLQDGLLDRPGASVVLTRSKTSMWIKPRAQGGPITAILLVDPTASTGHALWGGYRPFEQTPSMASWKEDKNKPVDAPGFESFFDDAKYWCSRLSADDLALVAHDPRCIALSVYKLVLADWLTTLKYMIAQLGKIEWEFEKPHWAETPGNIDKLLGKISPWRRNVGYYQTMISEAIARLYPPEVRAPLHALGASGVTANTDPLPARLYLPGADGQGIPGLWVDFQNVKRQMDEIQIRLKSIETMATNAINIEESRRAVKQNKNLARLTFLATIFIPLNFTSSFLSISPNFNTAGLSIGLFFAIGVPLTIVALLAVDLSHPQKKGVLQQQWRKWRSKSAKKKQQASRPSSSANNDQRDTTMPPLIKIRTTIPWLMSSESQGTKS